MPIWFGLQWKSNLSVPVCFPLTLSFPVLSFPLCLILCLVSGDLCIFLRCPVVSLPCLLHLMVMAGMWLVRSAEEVGCSFAFLFRSVRVESCLKDRLTPLLFVCPVWQRQAGNSLWKQAALVWRYCNNSQQGERKPWGFLSAALSIYNSISVNQL